MAELPSSRPRKRIQTSIQIEDEHCAENSVTNIEAKAALRHHRDAPRGEITFEQQAEYAELKRRNSLQQKRGPALVSQLQQWVWRVVLVIGGTYVAIFIGEGWPGVMAAGEHGLVKLAFLAIVLSTASVMYNIVDA
jgi:hypothetical protein